MDKLIYTDNGTDFVYCYFDKHGITLEQDSLNGIDKINLTREQAREIMRTIGEYLDDDGAAVFVAENA